MQSDSDIFAPSKNLNRQKIKPQFNLERFLMRNNFPPTRLQNEIYRALIVPNWPKWQS